ncbi:hypothetical protein ABFT80_03885 [Mesorhizobium sp. SB112]|uniref:hypothetical protein n=1 Tax=Mesorhizobium sp. SB112 TaxID=3151853 RepID=UPI003265B9DB
MTKKLKAGLVAAAIAAIIGIAVSYGLISRETGDEIRTQTDQILNEDDAPNRPPATENTNAPPPTSGNTPPQPPATTAPEANEPTGQPSE